MKLEFDNGKYTYIHDGSGRQYALRYGEMWRELTGDKLVYWMATTITNLMATAAHWEGLYQQERDLCDSLARENTELLLKVAKLDKAVEHALTWDQCRRFIMPYHVRDPLRDALGAHQTPSHQGETHAV